MKTLFHTPTGTTVPYNRRDDEPPVGLSAEYQAFELIDPEPPAHDTETHYAQRLQEQVDTTAKTVTRGWEIIAREMPPVVVTMRSFRLALGRTRYIELMAFVGAITDAEQKWQAQTYIEYSNTVDRDHPMVMTYAAALNKPDAEVDAIFAAAKQLDESA